MFNGVLGENNGDILMVIIAAGHGRPCLGYYIGNRYPVVVVIFCHCACYRVVCRWEPKQWKPTQFYV